MKKVLPSLAVAAILVVSCAENMEPASAPAPAKQEAAEPAFVPGSIIVQLDENQTDVMAALGGLGVLSAERLYPDGGRWEARHRAAGLDRWYRVTYDPSARPATKAAADFSSVPGIVYAEPERRLKSSAYFNDPYASQQWALFNDGTKGPKQAAGCDINVEPVWDLYTTGTPNVIVAVIDTGIDIEHPDLASIIVPPGPEGSKCFVYGYEPYEIPADDHGTHVAGIIAAINNNEVGVSGIAGGNDGTGGVRILSLSMMSEDPNDPDHLRQGDASAAFIWAADHGAVIAQNSWTNVYETEEDALSGGIGYMKTPIDYFIKYAGCDEDGNQLPDSPMKGGVVFFAAGNETWSIGWPSAYENVISVGALTAQYTRASYSNFGDWVDICAPGGDAKEYSLIMSTVAGGYDKYQGTSMACPHVSGVAALLISYYGGPGFTNDMLKEKILGGANPDKVVSPVPIGPMLDALGAFTYGSTVAPDLPADLAVGVSSNKLTLSWTVTADADDIRAYSYLVLASKDASALSGIDPDNIPETVISSLVKVGRNKVGDPISTDLAGLEFETEYHIAMLASDYVGNHSALSAVQTISTGKNNAPVVETENAGGLAIKPFEKVSVDYTVYDPNGHAFTLDVDPGSKAFKWSQTDSLVQVTITGSAAPAGAYTAHIVATDSYGAVTDFTVDYEILENHAPAIVSAMENAKYTKSGQKSVFDMSKYFSDADGEALTYSVKMSEKGVATINQTGNTLVLNTLGFGLTEVTVTAVDACKASATQTFKVLVRDESVPVDIYPNPVVDVLNIRPATEGKLDLTVYNKAGSTVWSVSQSDASPFDPVTVDLSGKPGGIYYVKVQGAGLDDTYTIAKR